MVKRRNKTLEKKLMAGSKCPCDMMGGSYYKYNDLRNATPRDFLLSERYGGSCKVGGKSRRKNYRKKGRKTKKVSRRKGRKFKKHYMWNTKGKRYLAKTYKQHIRGAKLGHTHKKPKRTMKGGLLGRNTIVPQDVVNMGRNTVHGADSFSKSWRGIEHSASPLPTKNQLEWGNDKFVYKPISLTEIRANAENQVGKL